MIRLWSLLFVLSGFAAILYEVTFNKHVSYVFGATAYATSTVLAAYMGGLSLGSFLGGRVADRVKRPLFWYGVLELGAALYFFVSADLLEWAGSQQAAFHGAGGVFLLTVFQFVSSFLIVMIPTVFLGATFPLVVKGLLGSGAYARVVSSLYLSNLVGTAFGVVLSAYVLIPQLGLTGTLLTSVTIAVFLLVLSLYLVSRMPPAAAPSAENGQAGTAQVEGDVEVEPGADKLGSRAMLVLACFSGFSVFGYEVVWTHLYALLLGNSVYSFSTVLFAVLLGMALGAAWVGRCRGRVLQVVLRAQVLFIVSTFLGIQFIDQLPDVFTYFGSRSVPFEIRELIKFATTAGTLLLPAVCLGIFFPALLVLAAPAAAKAGRMIGSLYSINTVGAVLGSLASGFVIIPLLGSKGSIYLLLLGNAAVVGFLALRTGNVRRRELQVAGMVMVLALIAHPRWNWQKLLQASGVYFTPMPTSTFARILANHEDVHGGITTVVESSEKIRYLLSNGKFQGDSGPEIVDQYSYALMTELHPHGYDRALNIGIGVGGTLGVLSLLPYKEVDGVELAQPMIDNARRFFSDVNFHSLDNPRVKLHVMDGRHFLSLLPPTTKYDAITIQVSSIWFAGAANLYSAEFYQLAAAHLQTRGVLQQWVQLHHTRPQDLMMVLKTIRSVFRHVELFVPGHQGIILASNDPLELEVGHLARLQMPKEIAAKGLSYEDLAGSILLSPRELDDMLAVTASDIPISTNDHPYLEFETPKGNALGFNFSEMVTTLLQYRALRDDERFTAAGAPWDDVERFRFKQKLRDLRLYLPYTTPWLGVVNEISAMELSPERERAFATMLLERRRP